MLIKGIYDRIKMEESDPNLVLSRLGNEFFAYATLNAFFSAILLDLDIEKGTISYSSAGHPEQIFFSGDRILHLPSTGKMVGLKKDNQYRVASFPFLPGDRLYLYTDGITEEFNSQNEMFGDVQFPKLMQELQNKDLSGWIPESTRILGEFTQGKKWEDDVTILCLGRK